MKFRRIVSLMALTALAACNDDPAAPDPLDQQINDDVAMVAADAALDDLQQMSFSFGGTPAPSAPSAAPPTRERTVTFFDADGNQMDRFDPLLTASINIHVEVSGEVVRDNWTATVERVRDLTVSGLEGQETSRTWNGTGSGSVTGSRHADNTGTRNYSLTTSVVIENVVVGLPRDENPWPLSGSITRSISVTITRDGVEVTRERTVVITFNGTQLVTMTVNGEEFELDLGAGQSDRAHHSR